MERRHFLKLAFGFAAGAAAFAASARAAPIMLQPLDEDGRLPPSNEDARPAVTSGDEVDHLKPEEVRWRRHWGWRRRYWRRRYWRRRYWYDGLSRHQLLGSKTAPASLLRLGPLREGGDMIA